MRGTINQTPPKIGLAKFTQVVQHTAQREIKFPIATWVLRPRGTQHNPISNQAIIFNTLGAKLTIWGAREIVWAGLDHEQA